jgi:hypothetical protein
LLTKNKNGGNRMKYSSIHFFLFLCFLSSYQAQKDETTIYFPPPPQLQDSKIHYELILKNIFSPDINYSSWDFDNQVIEHVMRLNAEYRKKLIGYLFKILLVKQEDSEIVLRALKALNGTCSCDFSREEFLSTLQKDQPYYDIIKDFYCSRQDFLAALHEAELPEHQILALLKKFFTNTQGEDAKQIQSLCVDLLLNFEDFPIQLFYDSFETATSLFSFKEELIYAIVVLEKSPEKLIAFLLKNTSNKNLTNDEIDFYLCLALRLSSKVAFEYLPFLINTYKKCSLNNERKYSTSEVDLKFRVLEVLGDYNKFKKEEKFSNYQNQIMSFLIEIIQKNQQENFESTRLHNISQALAISACVNLSKIAPDFSKILSIIILQFNNTSEPEYHPLFSRSQLLSALNSLKLTPESFNGIEEDSILPLVCYIGKSEYKQAYARLLIPIFEKRKEFTSSFFLKALNTNDDLSLQEGTFALLEEISFITEPLIRVLLDRLSEKRSDFKTKATILRILSKHCPKHEELLLNLLLFSQSNDQDLRVLAHSYLKNY